MADSWDDRAYLRGTQYKTDTNLAARQSIYAYQQPRLDLAARVLDLAGPRRRTRSRTSAAATAMYLAEPAPIADYVRSLPGAPHGAGAAELAATVAAALPRTPEGHFVITARTGCLICRAD